MDVAVMQITFKQKINELLIAKKMRKADLARAMSVHPTYLTQYISGDVSPGLDVIEKFARALRVEPWQLLDDTPVAEILAAS